MTFQYVSVDEAIRRSGVRMVVVGGVPSPWGEAAKAFFTSRISSGRRSGWFTTASR
jgi:hypothetical protein